jgi:hypothetical protein
MYRITLGRGGFDGYYKVQRRTLGIWHTLNKYSIYVHGHSTAYAMACVDLDRLKENG